MGRGKQLDRPPRLGHARLVKAVREAHFMSQYGRRLVDKWSSIISKLSCAVLKLSVCGQAQIVSVWPPNGPFTLFPSMVDVLSINGHP